MLVLQFATCTRLIARIVLLIRLIDRSSDIEWLGCLLAMFHGLPCDSFQR
jgi:hypothetical protein